MNAVCAVSNIPSILRRSVNNPSWTSQSKAKAWTMVHVIVYDGIQFSMLNGAWPPDPVHYCRLLRHSWGTDFPQGHTNIQTQSFIGGIEVRTSLLTQTVLDTGHQNRLYPGRLMRPRVWRRFDVNSPSNQCYLCTIGTFLVEHSHYNRPCLHSERINVASSLLQLLMTMKQW